MRLIDADKLIDYIDPDHLRNNYEKCFSEQDIVNMINKQPTEIIPQPPKGDLISRQALLSEWDDLSTRGRTEFDQVIMTQPTAYSIDKIIDEMREHIVDYSPDGCENNTWIKAITIVKKGCVSEANED